jgi:hypothetical protein
VTYKLLRQTNWPAMQLSLKLFSECRLRWPVTCIIYFPVNSYQKRTELIPIRTCWMWGCLLTPAWEIRGIIKDEIIPTLFHCWEYQVTGLSWCIFQPNMLLLTNRRLQGILVQGKTLIDRRRKNRSGNVLPVPEVVLVHKHISSFPAREPLLRNRL